MTVVFLDTSALVKRYLPEPGSAWIERLCDPASTDSVAVAEITLVEVAAALAARQRASGGMSIGARDAALALFRRHYTTEYAVTAFSGAILDSAVELTQRHRLRGYDAIQLATAITANQLLRDAGQPALLFVSADHDLIAAARAESLLTDEPAAHM